MVIVHYDTIMIRFLDFIMGGFSISDVFKHYISLYNARVQEQKMMHKIIIEYSKVHKQIQHRKDDKKVPEDLLLRDEMMTFHLNQMSELMKRNRKLNDQSWLKKEMK